MDTEEIKRLLLKHDAKAAKEEKAKYNEIKEGFKALGVSVLVSEPFILINAASARAILAMLRGSKAPSRRKTGSTLRLLEKTPDEA